MVERTLVPRRLGAALLGLVCLALPLAAAALDQPVAGQRLVIQRTAGGAESLVFVTTDPATPFPAIGGADDPATGSPGGAVVEVFSQAEPGVATLPIPAGAGTPGWRSSTAGEVDRHWFANSLAPAGISPVRAVTMREGRLLRVVARDTGLALAAAQGAVAVRVTMGTLRLCALFGPSTVRVDQANRFVARNSLATALPDCDIDLQPTTLDRPADPVVLTGAQIPALQGIAPGDLVAFRFSGGWAQIPVQVDERKTVSMFEVYDGKKGGSVTVPGYADPGTHNGGDPDPLLDADDEVVFMAADAGGPAGASSAPAGVEAGSGVEVAIADPAAPGAGYVYLFRDATGLDPAAGQQYVDYAFDLLSGPYLTTYHINDGPNPEDTTVTTDLYARHFSDRWVEDELRILAGAASGVDLLDRHKALFAPSVCGRSEDTFVDGEGAFVANRGGPVRAIRSYVGANSGPLTQREHLFYRGREDVRTFLRVHAIPGVMDFFDYAPAASGMTYRDSLNPSGVPVDGVPDTVVLGQLAWQLLSGGQGSLTHVITLDTDIAGLTPTSYYLDDSTPPDTQCTGDAFAYASSGPRFAQSIPNTDPLAPPYKSLATTRTIYYDAPGLAAADAEVRASWATAPLVATAAAWP